MDRFTIHVPSADVIDLERRLAATRWPDEFDNADWRFGVEREWLRDVTSWWMTHYDWRAAEARLNAFDHWRASIDGLPIHFVHVRGKGPDPMPLILTHGWPWTFWDWERTIGPLTDPASHGGHECDAFDLIIPSLPGFIFSSPLRRSNIHVRAIADLWARLMRDHLGYQSFMAAGGDWGSLISAELAHAHPEYVRGVHLTLPILPGVDPTTVRRSDYAEDEKWMVDRVREARSVSRSHLEVHRRSSQTLAYAFEDSPVGLAAWMWERRRNWSDCAGNIEQVFDRDFLCTTASLYWFTRSAGTAMRLYAAQADANWSPLHARRRLIDVPTAFALAPKELFLIPRQIAEQRTNLSRWTVLERGGHFLPMEAPDLLIREYRSFARTLR